jgi:RNA polymerase sigma-70 factor (ECF subfamily)
VPAALEALPLPVRVAAWIAAAGRGVLLSWTAPCEQRGQAQDQAGEDAVDLDRSDVDATLAGDEDAFQRLVRRHQDAVARWMHRFTRDRATLEELVQDVFVEAWSSLSGWRGEAPLSHWLGRVAVRTGYRFWKARDRQADPLEDGVAEQLPAPDDDGSARELAEWVHVWLARLPPRDRVVLTLTLIEQRSVAETADLLGWSRTMVKVQAHRARGKLRKLLEGTTT